MDFISRKFLYKILLEQKGNNKQKLSIFLSQDELGTLIHKVIGDYIKFIGQNSNKNIWTDGFDKIIRNAINNNSYLFDFSLRNRNFNMFGSIAIETFENQ